MSALKNHVRHIPMNHTQKTHMNNDIQISIIIPTYNVGALVSRCLNDICNQDFSAQYEIIVIDDHSADDTVEKCQKILANFTHHKIIKKDHNSGCAASRNIGIQQAKGKYLCFVDPDDSVPQNALSLLFLAAEQHSADIVKGSNSITRNNISKPASYNSWHEKILYKEDIIAALLSHTIVRGHPWGKLLAKKKQPANRLLSCRDLG